MQMFSENDYEAKMCHLVHHSYFADCHGTAAHRDYRFSYSPAFGHLLEYSPQHCARPYLRFPSKHRASLHFFQLGDARFEKEKSPIKIYDELEIPQKRHP
jgi:hypothetical protein